MGGSISTVEVSFGVTNGVAVFQRKMNKLIQEEHLKDTFPYLVNITVAGKIKKEYKRNVQKF